jgi:hypothetical protein
MSEAPVSAPKGDVKLPGLGPVPKKWFIIVGIGSLATIAYVVYRRKQTAASTTAATTDTTGTAALAGQPCVDANGNPGVYDSSGICQVDTAALGGYYSGYGALGVSGVTPPVPGTGGFTTNGQWTQQAEADMAGTGVDPGTLAAALGAYIAGQAVTPAQQSLIDQAIAFEGYPPVAGPGGYPPALKSQPAVPPPVPTPTPTPTPTPGQVTKYPAPTGFKASSIGISSVILSWDDVPTKPAPESYTVQVWTSTGANKLVWQSTTAHDMPGGITQMTVTGLVTKTAYHARVWANGGKIAPPGTDVSFTTH